MRRLEQRGAVAFTAMGVAVVVILRGDLANHPVGASVLEDDAPLTRLFGQPKLLHLRAHLVHVPAKKLAVSAIVRPLHPCFPVRDNERAESSFLKPEKFY